MSPGNGAVHVRNNRQPVLYFMCSAQIDSVLLYLYRHDKHIIRIASLAGFGCVNKQVVLIIQHEVVKTISGILHRGAVTNEIKQPSYTTT